MHKTWCIPTSNISHHTTTCNDPTPNIASTVVTILEGKNSQILAECDQNFVHPHNWHGQLYCQVLWTYTKQLKCQPTGVSWNRTTRLDFGRTRQTRALTDINSHKIHLPSRMTRVENNYEPCLITITVESTFIYIYVTYISVYTYKSSILQR